jgi:hypothetical protein
MSNSVLSTNLFPYDTVLINTNSDGLQAIDDQSHEILVRVSGKKIELFTGIPCYPFL